MRISQTKQLAVLLLVLAFSAAAGAKSGVKLDLDLTVDQVAQEAAKRLKANPVPGVKNITLAPLWGQCDQQQKEYILSMIESHMADGPYTFVERDLKAWDNLLKEIEWGDLKENKMDQATIQHFGRIKGCQAVIYGTIRECAAYPGRVITRLTLKMGIVETGEVKWSTAGEIRAAKVTEIVIPTAPEMNPALIRAVNLAAEQAAKSLKENRQVVESLAFFPFAGNDEDHYVSKVLLGNLAKAGCSPAWVSPIEWRDYLAARGGSPQDTKAMRDFAKEKGYSAFLHGSVNERRVRERKYKAAVRILPHMVDVDGSGNPWSPGEIVVTAWLDWQDIIRLAIGDPIVWVLGGLIIVLIVWRAWKRLFRSMTKPR